MSSPAALLLVQTALNRPVSYRDTQTPLIKGGVLFCFDETRKPPELSIALCNSGTYILVQQQKPETGGDDIAIDISHIGREGTEQIRN
jgi:hypothetical protein